MQQSLLFAETEFDAQRSGKRKRQGMDRAADGNRGMLAVARELAMKLARNHPEGITADDVMRELVRQGNDVHCLGNAAGSLFRGKQWEFTGEFRKSQRTHAHANLLRVWTLKEGEK